MMIGLGVIIGRGTYLVGGVAKVWEISVATGRVQWVNWDPSPFTRNTSLGIFCGQVNGADDLPTLELLFLSVGGALIRSVSIRSTNMIVQQ